MFARPTASSRSDLQSVLRLNGITFTIKNDSPEPLGHLFRYLNPSSAADWIPGTTSRRIHCFTTSDTDQLASTVRSSGVLRGRIRTHVDAFHQKYEIVDQRGVTEAFLPPRRWRYVILRSARMVELWQHPEGRDRDRHLLRLVREITYRRMETLGGLAFHAASASVHGRSVLIVGAAGAGKTTVLLWLLARCGAHFICNDRPLLFSSDGHAFKIVYTPLPVRVTPATCAAIPELQDYVSAATRMRDHLLGRYAQHGTLSDAKLEFDPTQISQALGVRRVATGTLAAIIQPQFSRSTERSRSIRIQPAAAMALLERECCTPTDNIWPTPWLEQRLAPRRPRPKIADVARVPCFRVSFGTTLGTQLSDVLSQCLRDAEIEG